MPLPCLTGQLMAMRHLVPRVSAEWMTSTAGIWAIWTYLDYYGQSPQRNSGAMWGCLAELWNRLMKSGIWAQNDDAELTALGGVLAAVLVCWARYVEHWHTGVCIAQAELCCVRW